MVEFENLNFSYNKNQIFNDFSCHIKEGSTVTMLLRSRSGKTTLFNLLNGTIRNKQAVIMDNLLITPETVHDIRLDTVFIPTVISEYFIFDNIYDELKLRPLQLGKPLNKVTKGIKETLKSLDLEYCLTKNPFELTTNEQYLLVLASILIIKPKYIVLDDSLALCDSSTKEIFIKHLKEQNSTTIIHLTSKVEEILWTKRCIVINNSKVVLDGPPKEVIKETSILRKSGFTFPFTMELSYKLSLYDMTPSITNSYRKLVMKLATTD